MSWVYLFTHVGNIFLALSTIPGSCLLRLWVPWLGSYPCMCDKAASPGVSDAVALQRWHWWIKQCFHCKHLRARVTLHVFLNTSLNSHSLAQTDHCLQVTLLTWSGSEVSSLSLCFMFLGSLCLLLLSFSSVLGEVDVGGQVFLSFYFFFCSWFFSSGWSRDDQ